jgi:hypothetical protein
MDPMTRLRTILVPVMGFLPAACGTVEPEPFPELMVTTEALPAATRGSAYAEAIHAAGGDGAYSWAVTAGTLPPGLVIMTGDPGADDAVVTGMPEAEGTFMFTVTVTSGDGQTASAGLSIQVLPKVPITIDRPFVPPALAGASYDVALRAQGGDGQTFQWSVVQGTLPAGLALAPEGRIHGTPQTPDTAQFTLQVTSGAQSVRQSYRLPVVPHRTGEYNITIFPIGQIPPGIRSHVEAAVAEWETAVTDDLQAVTIPAGFFAGAHCGGFGELMNGTSTDDVLIALRVAPIDGPGGVLGRAGPCGIRSGTDIPFAGLIVLDSDDLLPLVGNQTLTYIISHEIAHVLGFGTIWELRELITGAGTGNPRFTGSHAIQAYQAIGGDGDVPVENQGGEGTRDSHWRQSVFGNERMTGFLAAPGVPQPLSVVSLASFRDLGYAVDLDAADSFTLAAALAAHGELSWESLGHDEVLREPVRVLEPVLREP